MSAPGFFFVKNKKQKAPWRINNANVKSSLRCIRTITVCYSYTETPAAIINYKTPASFLAAAKKIPNVVIEEHGLVLQSGVKSPIIRTLLQGPLLPRDTQ